ncbi:hypothetical protein, partial [Butyricimonas virosa]
ATDISLLVEQVNFFRIRHTLWYYNFSRSVREENYIVYICIRVKQKPLNRKYERDCCEIYRKLVLRTDGFGGGDGMSD